MSSRIRNLAQAFIAVFNNVGEAAFLGEIKNLRHFGQPNGKANKFANSYRINTILGDSELLEVGLPEYVKKMQNVSKFSN